MANERYKRGTNYKVAEAIAMAILHDLEPLRVTKGDVPSRIDRVARRIRGEYSDTAIQLLFSETRNGFIDHVSEIVEDRNQFRGMFYGLK